MAVAVGVGVGVAVAVAVVQCFSGSASSGGLGGSDGGSSDGGSSSSCCGSSSRSRSRRSRSLRSILTMSSSKNSDTRSGTAILAGKTVMLQDTLSLRSSLDHRGAKSLLYLQLQHKELTADTCSRFPS